MDRSYGEVDKHRGAMDKISWGGEYIALANVPRDSASARFQAPAPLQTASEIYPPPHEIYPPFEIYPPPCPKLQH